MYLLIVLTICHFGMGKINVWNPPTLASAYKDKAIEYTVADMGDVPYGKTLVGRLVQANPFGLCALPPGHSIE